MRCCSRRWPSSFRTIDTPSCAPGAVYWSLDGSANVRLLRFDAGAVKEWSRFRLETFGIGRIARQQGVDVIWSGTGLGPYVRTGIPQALLMSNAFLVYPWSVAHTILAHD